ncbi:LOW QUALITY PROTEIN: hypothetical protein TorRG33x02_303910 [Trema orientale]|uniref:Uncharacterized protein n=1 Tax=Trema orientale TaxID=63057 RepID=A0A2P5BYV9_TREOI|nr:LOW QUALITY PROTEIN: hypothetical protein TorRG33x02_303910 [Trema orientale]
MACAASKESHSAAVNNNLPLIAKSSA